MDNDFYQDDDGKLWARYGEGSIGGADVDKAEEAARRARVDAATRAAFPPVWVSGSEAEPTQAEQQFGGVADNNPKRARALLDNKVPMEYLPIHVLEGVARVLRHGAEKYGRNNWTLEPIAATTYVGAFRRHIDLEWAVGIDEDHDSGEHPLCHVIANAMIVLDSIEKGKFIDDRLTAEVVGREEK